MDSLVEERVEEMVSFTHLKEPIKTKRRAWFLKSISTSSTLDSCPFSQFTPSRHETMIFPKTDTALANQFTWWAKPRSQWVQWVNKLKPKYKDLWKKVGIFDAIMASTYEFKKDPSSLLGVVSFWCKETNTFHFPWGEATLTLEDVMVLGGFSVLGEFIRNNSNLEGELAEIGSKMLEEYGKFGGEPLHGMWIRHFMEEGLGNELEHIALLSLWLSRFVFPAFDGETLGQHVIPIAIRLARGIRIALGPLVLASLYRALTQIKDHLVRQYSYSPNVWAPLYILQVWVWERFLALRPEPKSISNSDEPRTARWHDVGKSLDFSFVMSVLESPNGFRWQPYKPSFYKDYGRWVSCDASGDEELKSFARCLTACKLRGLDCFEEYCPHRVAMQFGLDQDIPKHVSTVTSLDIAYKTYCQDWKNVKFYVPPRLFDPAVTLQYSIWWKNFGREEEIVEDKKRKRSWSPTIFQKKQASAARPVDASSNVSSQCLETTNHGSEVSGDIGVIKRKQEEKFASDLSDGKCKGNVKDCKEKSAQNSACKELVIEEPGANIQVEEIKVSSVVIDKYEEREQEIKKLKEEIASIQAQILELESRQK